MECGNTTLTAFHHVRKDPEGTIHDLLAEELLPDRDKTGDRAEGLHPPFGSVGNALGNVDLGLLNPLGCTLKKIRHILEGLRLGLDEVTRKGIRI